jgi:hypothetical protein
MSVIPLSSTSAPVAPAGPVSPDFDAFTEWLEPESFIPADLSAVSTRELRVLCNELYSMLDVDFPPYGAQQDYDALVSELEERAVEARRRA